jgi:hypothetical protein
MILLIIKYLGQCCAFLNVYSFDPVVHYCLGLGLLSQQQSLHLLVAHPYLYYSQRAYHIRIGHHHSRHLILIIQVIHPCVWLHLGHDQHHWY